MTSRKETQLTLEVPLVLALQHAENAAISIGAQIINKGPDKIIARKAGSLISFGEDIQISTVSSSPTTCTLKILSESSLKTTLFDYGINANNVDKIVEILRLAVVPKAGDQRYSDNISNSIDNQKSPAHIKGSAGLIFISYRRADSADIAGRIYDRLVNKFGNEPVFKDVDSIPLGVDFKEYLGMKVSECKVLLAIIGDRWVEASDAAGKKRLDDPADFVRIEIESALERGIPVIPLVVRGAQMPEEENLPVSLRKLVYKNGIQIRSDPDFHHDMDRLISALEKQFS